MCATLEDKGLQHHWAPAITASSSSPCPAPHQVVVVAHLLAVVLHSSGHATLASLTQGQVGVEGSSLVGVLAIPAGARALQSAPALPAHLGHGHTAGLLGVGGYATLTVITQLQLCSILLSIGTFMAY